MFQLRPLRLLLLINIIAVSRAVPNISNSASTKLTILDHILELLSMQDDAYNIKLLKTPKVLEQYYQSLPSSCAEALVHGKKSGVYKIYLPTSELKPFFVYCLEDPNNGSAWTLLQRRLDDSINFNLTWNDYKLGFGNLEGNHFLGLDKIHALTHSHTHQMWASFSVTPNYTYNITYDSFLVGDESTNYVVMSLGAQHKSGDRLSTSLRWLIDSINLIPGQMFTTKDVDNDNDDKVNCAEMGKGGWWYDDCHHRGAKYMHGDFHYNFRYIHMAIRPVV